MDKKIEMEPVLIYRRDVCRLLNISEKTFSKLKNEKKIPLMPIILGGCVRYRRDDVIKWVNEGCPYDWYG